MAQIDRLGFELVAWANAPYFIGHNPEMWECPDCCAIMLQRGVESHWLWHDREGREHDGY